MRSVLFWPAFRRREPESVRKFPVLPKTSALLLFLPQYQLLFQPSPVRSVPFWPAFRRREPESVRELPALPKAAARLAADQSAFPAAFAECFQFPMLAKATLPLPERAKAAAPEVPVVPRPEVERLPLLSFRLPPNQAVIPKSFSALL